MNWKITEQDQDKWVAYHKDEILIRIAQNVVCISPDADCEDYIEKCDMMSIAVFAYTLYGIYHGYNQGRVLVRNSIRREDAIWFLGLLGLTLEDETDVKMQVMEGQLIC